MNGSLGSVRARRTLEALRARITSGEWAVNARIPPEPALIEMLGVGRTTVREAVRSLASMGMLETLPGIGTFVRSRTPVSALLADWIGAFDIDEILSYRRVLEIEAVRRAAVGRIEAEVAAMHAALDAERARSDDPAVERVVVERGRTPGQFHTLVFEAARSRLLLDMYTGTLTALRAATSQGTLMSGIDPAARQADHARILDAIAAGNAEAATAAMAAHLDRDLVAVPPATPKPLARKQSRATSRG